MQIKQNDRKYFYASSFVSFILKNFYSILKGEREREREKKREEGKRKENTSVMRDYRGAP